MTFFRYHHWVILVRAWNWSCHYYLTLTMHIGIIYSHQELQKSLVFKMLYIFLHFYTFTPKAWNDNIKFLLETLHLWKITQNRGYALCQIVYLCMQIETSRSINLFQPLLGSIQNFLHLKHIWFHLTTPCTQKSFPGTTQLHYTFSTIHAED